MLILTGFYLLLPGKLESTGTVPEDKWQVTMRDTATLTATGRAVVLTNRTTESSAEAAVPILNHKGITCFDQVKRRASLTAIRQT